jgi:hypothetical protein
MEALAAAGNNVDRVPMLLTNEERLNNKESRLKKRKAKPVTTDTAILDGPLQFVPFV